MTRYEFLALCGEHNIDPGLVLENDDVVDALRDHDDDEVERLLREEF